jgi:hypothetical protein
VSRGGRETEDGLKSAVSRRMRRRWSYRRWAGERRVDGPERRKTARVSASPQCQVQWVGGNLFLYFEMGWSEHNIRYPSILAGLGWAGLGWLKASGVTNVMTILQLRASLSQK